MAREEADDEEPVPFLVRVRAGHPPRGFGIDHLTPEERRYGSLVVYPDVDRPRTRGDCIDGPRPCPFVSCAHHLYLDVNPANGSIKVNFPHLEVWEMTETCALDVADNGGWTLENVGVVMRLTRERVRQVEMTVLRKIRNGNSPLNEGEVK